MSIASTEADCRLLQPAEVSSPKVDRCELAVCLSCRWWSNCRQLAGAEPEGSEVDRGDVAQCATAPLLRLPFVANNYHQVEGKSREHRLDATREELAKNPPPPPRWGWVGNDPACA